MTRCALLTVVLVSAPASAAELDGTAADGSGTVGIVLTVLLLAGMALRSGRRRSRRS